MRHETKYAKSGDLSIAYQVVGHGSRDLVFVMGWVSHIEMFWTEPHFARFLERLASFSRLILFDKRGTGLSDRPAHLPTLEERMDDVRAVMDAAGSERAALFGVSEGGPMCALFAATYPERTTALIIDGGYARSIWTPDYPWAKTVEQRERYFAYMEAHWGSDVWLEARAPTLARDPEFRQWWSTYLRMSASPGAAVAFSRMNWQIDIRNILPTIHVPTLVMHREGDQAVHVGNGRYLAEHIPGATYVEMPGNDHVPFSGDQDAVLDQIEMFLTGTRRPDTPDKVLATILVVEIVESMVLATRLGEAEWNGIHARYHEMARDEIARWRGREVRRTGAGGVAAFDGPARAIRCARAIVGRASALGLRVRAGLHTGECEVAEDDVRGPAAQIAAWVLARAGPGEVVVSGTIFDLVAGSGIEFEQLDHALTIGPSRQVQLYRVASTDEPRSNAMVTARVDIHPKSPLSPRELEVATLIGRGLSNRMIADELSISIATVERHAANIFTKLGVRSRASVAVWAAANDLLSVHSS